MGGKTIETQRLFLYSMCMVYFFAFSSLYFQVPGKCDHLVVFQSIGKVWPLYCIFPSSKWMWPFCYILKFQVNEFLSIWVIIYRQHEGKIFFQCNKFKCLWRIFLQSYFWIEKFQIRYLFRLKKILLFFYVPWILSDKMLVLVYPTIHFTNWVCHQITSSLGTLTH